MDSLRFINGSFTILQVSDPQDMHFVRKAMTKMLDRAYDTVKPDLVLFTGDNILGNHLRDARYSSKPDIFDKESELKRMKTALGYILKPVSDRKIPFAFIYGNHDDRNSVTKDEQAAIYKSYPYCVPFNENNKSVDCDTYYIPVFGSDGREKLGIFMLDSAWYDKEQNKCFEMIKPEAVSWYISESRNQRSRNGGGNIPSLLFTHIPLPVTERLFEECDSSHPKAVRGKNNKFYKLIDSVNGTAAEYSSVMSSDSGLYEAMKAEKNVTAAVFGHDHPNCFTAEIDGIDIIQTPCASFRCYGNETRGVRVFTFDENRPGEYESHTLTYFDLIKPTPLSKLRYLWDADDKLGKIRL